MAIDDDDFDLEDMELRDHGDGDEWKTAALRSAAKPLYKLALQILKTTTAIVETIPDDKPEMEHMKGWMMENALKLAPKISGAMATGDYILMTENATVIKLAARELMTQTSGLKMFGYKDTQYLQALRSEIEEFRKLFVSWVRAFPKDDPLWPDGWGLFYTDKDVQKWNELNPDEPREE